MSVDAGAAEVGATIEGFVVELPPDRPTRNAPPIITITARVAAAEIAAILPLELELPEAGMPPVGP